MNIGTLIVTNIDASLYPVFHGLFFTFKKVKLMRMAPIDEEDICKKILPSAPSPRPTEKPAMIEKNTKT
jgi:hypothetical protein